MIVFVAASYPVIKSIATDGCILEGQNVSLTCQVTYNGTNLMPLVMEWYKYAWYSGSYGDVYEGRGSTVNVSSVHQSSLTFTANTTDIYKCVVSCSSPTGIVVRGVEDQSRSTFGSFWSPPFGSSSVASKTTVYMLIVNVVSIADYYLEMGKNPHFWGSVLFGFYKKIGVRFGSSSLQAQKQWVQFCSGSSVETSVRFCFVLYGFGKRLTVSSQLITQLENCNLY